ncbi:17406_t:CDS:2, partial [Dentiscutata heterogama]
DPTPPKLPEPSELPEPEEGSKEGESDYEIADEGNTSDSESESNNKSESEEKKPIFRRIEDLAPKSNVYKRELAQLGGIKIKIVLIAYMYQIAQGGYFGHRIDQDIAFPNKIDEIEQNQHSDWIYEYEKKIFLEINERYFEACMKAYLASEKACRQGRRARNLHNVSRLQRFNNILDFSGINFLSTLRDIDIFEENNPNYAVNIFYPVPEKNDKEQATRKLDPFRLLEYNYQREYIVDLILFTKGEEDLRDRCNINEITPGLNTHYCLINSKNGWNRIMQN